MVDASMKKQQFNVEKYQCSLSFSSFQGTLNNRLAYRTYYVSLGHTWVCEALDRMKSITYEAFYWSENSVNT